MSSRRGSPRYFSEARFFRPLEGGRCEPALRPFPLGRGWDLFGTALVAWTPLKPEWMGVLQAVLILGGQAAALRAAWRAASTLHTSAQRAAVTAFLPTAAVASAASLLLLWLHVG